MFIHTYNSIITIENLLLTWERFLRGKKKKKDVLVLDQDINKEVLV